MLFGVTTGETTVQTCIVHRIRLSLKYVPRREREQIARARGDDGDDRHLALARVLERAQELVACRLA